MRQLNVDVDALLAAFEFNTENMNYYLDLKTGQVVMVTEETQWELEAIYEEFYNPDSDEDFDLTNVLKQRNIPEWKRHALRQADEVEEYYIVRYIDIPKTDSSAAYGDMQAFINTIEDKDLRQRLWRVIGGSGAFRNFKDELRNHPYVRNRWFGFSGKRARARVLAWLRSQDVEPSQQHPSGQVSSPPMRARLIAEVLSFVREAKKLPGILRIALIGSLTTEKTDPKDADILVTIADDINLAPLADLGRKLQGHAQSFNRGGDVFLADSQNTYLGRICPWKQCSPGVREACDALHCGAREYLHDDLHTIRLSTSLVATPPVELWPDIITHTSIPKDLEFGLLAPLRAEQSL